MRGKQKVIFFCALLINLARAAVPRTSLETAVAETRMRLLASGTKTKTGKARLGDACKTNETCESGIVGGQCRGGHCRCPGYFAEYNGTRCLEAALLGDECLVEEQCSLKVRDSRCIGGICRCREDRLRFRRHTCLGPAKLGEICYDHAHCRLWERDSYCDFLIPDLFGRCQCAAPTRREGQACRPDRLVAKDPPSSGPPYATDLEEFPTFDNSDIDTVAIVDASQVVGAQDTDLTAPREDEGATENDDGDSVIVEAEPSSGWIGPTKADRREPLGSLGPISLGLPCSLDDECRLADPLSRCIGGVCDCGFSGNGSCAASNGRCVPGTFQCRSSGLCVSWFFVCDGKSDCSDGSDEECRGPRCPDQAFSCRGGELCLSKSVICDGRRDCPEGDDEAGCTQGGGCPPDSFECGNGQCLPAYEFCNAVVSCRDGTDESAAACRVKGRTGRTNRSRLSNRWNRGNRGTVGKGSCPFQCKNGSCRSDAILCSGRDGCGDGSDEIRCSVCRCTDG